MFGEPLDREGECNACLFLADNYGDGSATIRCPLELNHEGVHRKQFERSGQLVTITWVVDERKRCDHGCDQWDHAHKSPYDVDAILCPRDAADHEYSDCAYCHPGEPPLTCARCGKTHYDEEDHKRHCAKEPYTCTTCGESGIGPHVWPSCPKEREVRLARGTADEYTADDYFAEVAPRKVVEEPQP